MMLLSNVIIYFR